MHDDVKANLDKVSDVGPNHMDPNGMVNLLVRLKKEH